MCESQFQQLCFQIPTSCKNKKYMWFRKKIYFTRKNKRNEISNDRNYN